MRALNQQELDLAIHIASMFATRSSQSVTDYCQEHFWLPAKLTPMPGPFRITNTPYLEEPLNCWGDVSLSFIDYCFGTQVAKTTLIMLGMGWSIKNAPGNTLWKLPTMPVVRSFNRRRWHPFVRANPILAMEIPADLDYFTLTEQHFLKCFVKFAGSHSIAELIESPVQRVVDDECDAGVPSKDGQASSSELAGERTKAFRNSLNIKASSPGKEPSLIWDSSHKGTFERYAVRCPQCETPFFLDWRDKDGAYFIKWDPAARLPNGKWDKARVRGTAHYECPKCKKQLNDSDKVQMLRRNHGAAWLATNPNHAPRHRSFQLGSIYSPWVTFAQMAEKWIDSSDSIFGLQIFINGWLGEVFSQTESEDFEFPESDYSMCTVSPAETGYVVVYPETPWVATHRIMTIDKQAGKKDAQTGIKDTPHLKVLVCEWNRNTGASRRLFYGRMPNEDEARAVQLAFGIPNALVGMDHGFDGTDVSRTCAKYGWTALKGDDREKFLWVEEGGAGTQSSWKPYAPKSRVHAYLGTAGGNKIVRLHLWSNPTIKDAFHIFKTGDGPEWKMARDMPEDYKSEINAEVKRKRFNPRTGKEVHEWGRVKDKSGTPIPNEGLDLECMQIVMASLICKIKFDCLKPALVGAGESTVDSQPAS